eukprot:TRINITY_DN14029_c0_g1_i1.p1 TRINITY_DN14029_c0_g1~~TRINITY_DN14029_c0_g1_i1.p1  ORF type:complete len:363 (-),score=44.74 TRINITY_DN14029_c0_g1_i1:31-1119(-)
MQKLLLRHGDFVRPIMFHKSMDVTSLCSSIKAAFQCGDVAAICEQTTSTVLPLPILLSFGADLGLTYDLIETQPCVQVRFKRAGVVRCATLQSGQDWCAVSVLLHTIFELSSSSDIVGVQYNGTLHLLSSVCANPASYCDDVLSLIVRGDATPVGPPKALPSLPEPRPDRSERSERCKSLQFEAPPGEAGFKNSKPADQNDAPSLRPPPSPTFAEIVSPRSPITSTVSLTPGTAGPAPRSVSPAPDAAEYDERPHQPSLLQKIDRVRRRVKLYHLNPAGDWDERGMGVCVCGASRSSGPAVLVVGDDNTLMLRAPVTPETDFVREQPTLIVWDETAISFQESQGCDEVWAQIRKMSARTSVR